MQPLLAMVIVGYGHSIQSSHMQSLLVAVIVGYSQSTKSNQMRSLLVTVTPQGVNKWSHCWLLSFHKELTNAVTVGYSHFTRS